MRTIVLTALCLSFLTTPILAAEGRIENISLAVEGVT